MGLGNARAEELEGVEAETYAKAFADAKELGLDNSDARDYASGLLLHATRAEYSDNELAGDAVIQDYAAAFAQPPDGSVANALGSAGETVRRNAIEWPFDQKTDSDESFAEHYASAFTLTGEDGVAAHLYASIYAGNRYLQAGDQRATELAEAAIRGYEQSSSPNLLERFAQAQGYMNGYVEAHWRAEPEQGLTSQNRVVAWAAAYARAYARAFRIARAEGRDEPLDAAHWYAFNFAHARVDMAFLEGDALRTAQFTLGGYYAAAEHGLRGEARNAYALDHYEGFWAKRGQAMWPLERAGIYAIAYADAKREGRTNENAEAHAEAYEQAYTSARREGTPEDLAHAIALAFAEAEAGEAPSPTPTP